MKRGLLLVVLLTLICTSSALAGKKWRTYEDCILRDKSANDGDSFHVRYKSEKGHYSYYLLRLYFVDTPESDDGLPDRVKQQAEYFGLSEKETVQLGKKAAKFTSEFLKDGFTVHTKHRDALGRSKKKRRYSMVEVDGKYLSEVLVENGLARVFGTGDDLPDGTREKTYWSRLRSAERKAKSKKVGGWAKVLTKMEQRQLEMQQKLQQVKTRQSTTREVGPVTDATKKRGKSAEQEVSEVLPHTRTLDWPLRVYSLKDSKHQLGMLKRGAKIEVLGLESESMVRIRFNAGQGKVYEAQCPRADLRL